MTTKQKTNFWRLIIVSVFLILAVGAAAYHVEKHYRNKEIEDTDATSTVVPAPYSFSEFFGFKDMSWKLFFFGMTAGVVFGFIDNFGLFYGMSALDPIFSKYDKLTQAGIGNTYSDFIGSTISIFIAMMMYRWADIREEKISFVSEGIGITIGCILGILIPRAIMKRMNKKT